MASIGINAAMHRACSSPHLATKEVKEPSQLGATRSLGTKQASTLVNLNVEGQNALSIPQEQKKNNVAENGHETETSSVKFVDERWKQGTWDLNMFVKSGKMDWDALIVAEAKRRKFLELFPEGATNEEPVLFRTSIIPWWAWITHSHLPEAELLNGRAAMIGFFMGYLVDVLTGLDVVGQSGNFICKVGLFATVLGVVLFRQTKSLKDLKNLADEATFYDKQWQASWQDQDSASGASRK
ncbi:chlorophyll A-B binding protein [Artemisia annua]|uniref:Chlorophyll A-B binding protein n=1 Tax=Artemisia annua TaxID=35608 RepID=A0A2U1NTI1_ARTAN|nr:chlorophyll A-B binding protein [Artemisia annua]